jgi:hypothetical protein
MGRTLGGGASPVRTRRRRNGPTNDEDAPGVGGEDTGRRSTSFGEGSVRVGLSDRAEGPYPASVQTLIVLDSDLPEKSLFRTDYIGTATKSVFIFLTMR